MSFAVPVLAHDLNSGTILEDPETKEREGHALPAGTELQWKPDSHMRWVALGVDYEMAGKA
jgi:lysyl-tRNA synthetase class I